MAAGRRAGGGRGTRRAVRRPAPRSPGGRVGPRRRRVRGPRLRRLPAARRRSRGRLRAGRRRPGRAPAPPHAPLAAALEVAAVASAVWAVTGARSLHHEAERNQEKHPACHDLAEARDVLPSLCGRDPAGLNAGEIARAVIESVAENTSDAVVAPLLWGAVAGIPGLVAYRAVNTLDAMVGHRSARYLRFGWASARLDDVANWRRPASPPRWPRPARPGGKNRPRRGPPDLRREGGNHPSPNAGRCEVAFAAALGVRLGGTNVYGGVAETRPELGGEGSTRNRRTSAARSSCPGRLPCPRPPWPC